MNLLDIFASGFEYTYTYKVEDHLSDKIIIVTQTAPDGTTEYAMFAVATIASLLGTVLGTLFTAPVEEETLRKFYNKTRPFGSWKRFKEKLNAEDMKGIDSENKRDIFSTFIAVPWQIVFFLFE